MNIWEWHRESGGRWSCRETSGDLGARQRIDVDPLTVLTAPGYRPTESTGAEIVGTVPPFAARPDPHPVDADAIWARRNEQQQSAFAAFWGGRMLPEVRP